jgi:hypothetical protein
MMEQSVQQSQTFQTQLEGHQTRPEGPEQPDSSECTALYVLSSQLTILQELVHPSLS